VTIDKPNNKTITDIPAFITFTVL